MSLRLPFAARLPCLNRGVFKRPLKDIEKEEDKIRRTTCKMLLTRFTRVPHGCSEERSGRPWSFFSP